MNSPAIDLLKKAATKKGFVASVTEVSNYHRVWARDGVICGLAGLVSESETLIACMKQTLFTLASKQNKYGNIPSNINLNDGVASFGGLAGRVDTLSWFVIGCCQYVYVTQDLAFLKEIKPHIQKALELMNIYEFNENHLMYVPRGGNWADEYIVQGHTLYDQCLRVWALKSFNHFEKDAEIAMKIDCIVNKIKLNYRTKNQVSKEKLYHPFAYQKLSDSNYLMAAIEPAGYQTQFDAFGNALAVLLNIEIETNTYKTIEYCEQLRNEMKLQLLPAFWPVISPGDVDWGNLFQYRKYEFRNSPYEFHNGGTWQMINAFYGLALMSKFKNLAEEVLANIQLLNRFSNNSFYENFNSSTGGPSGVKECVWSAAGEIILHKSLEGKKLIY